MKEWPYKSQYNVKMFPTLFIIYTDDDNQMNGITKTINNNDQ